MKLKNISIIIAICLSFVFGSFVLAQENDDLSENNTVLIQKDEVYEGNLFTVQEEIIVDGRISGDLIALAQSIVVNGDIAGDLIAVSQEIVINGRVEGNVRSASSLFSLNGYVGKNVNILAQELYLNPNSLVGWDVVAKSDTCFIKGAINGSLKSSCQNLIIDGPISKSVDVSLVGEYQSFNLMPKASIGGPLKYKANNEILIADINNISTVEFIKSKDGKENSINVIKTVVKILMAFLVALCFITLFKKTNNRIIKSLISFSGKDVVLPLIFLILLPLLILLMFISIIGIPLSMILLSLYLTLIYLAKIISAIFLGTFIYDQFSKKKYYFLFILLGIAIIWSLFTLPYVGNLLSLLAIIFGLSGLIKYVKNQPRNF